jgi:hypothetical protein
MKKLICLLIALTSSHLPAHEIEGTLVLKGSLKAKIMVNNIKTDCKVKVDEVKNLMEEDSFGNPAYKIKLEISLNGRDKDRKVKFDQKVWVNNLFEEGNGSIVKDLEYSSPEGTKLFVNHQGHMKSVQFIYSGQKISCAF